MCNLVPTDEIRSCDWCACDIHGDGNYGDYILDHTHSEKAITLVDVHQLTAKTDHHICTK